MSKISAMKNFRTAPGVGKEISENLWNAGIRSVSCLKGKNPEKLYEKLCKHEGKNIDRCMLYVLRCAVHYANTGKRTNWWDWKSKSLSPLLCRAFSCRSLCCVVSLSHGGALDSLCGARNIPTQKAKVQTARCRRRRTRRTP